MILRTRTGRGDGAGVAAAGLPLPTLLSQALVAFTIEFDNEFEHRSPHRTTDHGSTGDSREGPWLASMVMCMNCMRFVGEDGVRVGELKELARTETNLNGMERWGYIAVEPDPADKRAKPPRSDWIIRATRRGQMAQKVWRPLFGEIEKRWEERFGKEEIDRLRKSLLALIERMDVELPDCLPILGYGLLNKGPKDERLTAGGGERACKSKNASGLPLPALLSRVLLAYALEFERESEFSLAICANVVLVLDEKGVRLRDLPQLSGVSKEAIHMAMGILRKKRIVVMEAESGVKVVRLTVKGREAQETYRQLVEALEKLWQGRFGKDNIRGVREVLEQLVEEPTAEGSPLFRGLEPYADGWRASVRKPGTLPHFPMVLHRGGYPDGS
jgi:DNA-binding MarR family transcriptional regulator